MVSKTKKANYHHGALREALIAATVGLIREKGVGAVSLREVARLAGVSTAAPYHHFNNRTALLAAVSEQGFKSLGERLRAVLLQSGGPGSLGTLVKTYVRFAMEEPAYFQLMFRPELTRPDDHCEVHAAGDAAFQAFTEVMAHCQDAGRLPKGESRHWLAMVWALAHGYASLWLDGPLEGRAGKLMATPAVLLEEVAAALDELLALAARTRL